MSSLEDIGFQSFIARDVVGAVAMSSSEMWIGGALVLGAVVGAVYAYPKPFLEVSHIPWKREGSIDKPHVRLEVATREDAQRLLYGQDLDDEALLAEDAKRRLSGYAPHTIGPRSDGSWVVTYLPEHSTNREYLPPGVSNESAQLPYTRKKLKDIERRGMEVAQIISSPTMDEVRVIPSRCTIHKECRQHPDTIGRACLMNQWDEKWKAGGPK